MNTIVSIIIPCFKRQKELNNLFLSLRRLEFSESYEIIVVDDGSKKPLVVLDNVKLIRLEKNVGPAQARNIAIEKAEGEFIWFLDSDSEIDNPFLLKNLVQHLREDKFLIGVGGEIIEINKKPYAMVPYHFPNWSFLVFHKPMDRPFTEYPKVIGSNNLLISKKNLISVGGFSTDFDMMEDNDLCLRLSNRPKSFLTNNGTCIIHHHTVNGREEGQFWFFSKIWNYVLTVHLTRVKLIHSNFPYRLLILPLLDIVFAPIVFFFQIFFIKKRSYSLFQRKTRSHSSFVTFNFLNLVAMIIAWIYGYKMLIKK
ncbi:MAG: glycosyltransferase family 2 protein [Patescibacteria group bacterium]